MLLEKKKKMVHKTNGSFVISSLSRHALYEKNKKYRKRDVLHYRYGWLCNYTSCYATTALQKLLGLLLSTLFLLQIADPFAMA